jgi:hypothetical protein
MQPHMRCRQAARPLQGLHAKGEVASCLGHRRAALPERVVIMSLLDPGHARGA